MAQFVGMILGAIVAAGLSFLPIHSVLTVGIGVVVIIVIYNLLGIRYSPNLPCLVVVMSCMNAEVYPFEYALGRLWDTAIGLAIGMVINVLVLPYDNSLKIRQAIEYLEKEVIEFLEDMFDGDNHIPSSEEVSKKLDFMHRQLQIFANQKFLIHLSRQRKELENFKTYTRKGRQLVVHMAVISHMHPPGRLSEENRHRLEACGAKILDTRVLDSVTERDVVTNYHVEEILSLRRELLDVLQQATTKR